MPSPYAVAIDAGHGGSPTSDPAVLWDPGVVANGSVEKDITLDLAFRLKALLEKERVKVVMTRTADQYLDISERWHLVQGSGARLFISLHVNAFDGDSSIRGLTVFYPRADSQAFAQGLDQSLASALQPFGVPDDGVAVKPDLWVHSDIPTATIEPAYLTNPQEAGLLARGDFRAAIVAGVFAGLLATDPKIAATYQQIRQVEQARAAREQADQAAASGIRRWELGGLASALGLLGVLIGRRALRTRSRARRRRRQHSPIRDPVHHRRRPTVGAKK